MAAPPFDLGFIHDFCYYHLKFKKKTKPNPSVQLKENLSISFRSKLGHYSVLQLQEITISTTKSKVVTV